MPGVKEQCAAHLEHARRRTLGLLAPIPDEDQRRQVSPLMSPLAWDLAHIGHYEELWLLRTLTGVAPTDELFDDVYDAFRHPRRDRPSLPMLDAVGARAFDACVRERVLETLATIELDTDDPLLREGFVYGMVVQHEHQHDETILATIQLMDESFRGGNEYALLADEHSPPLAPGEHERERPRDEACREVCFPGGAVVIGTDRTGARGEPWAYDNECPAHEVDVAPFAIDVSPVTNASFAAFVDGGGYDDERLWSAEGWAWRNSEGLVAPQFWLRAGTGDGASAGPGVGSWARRRFGRVEDLPADEPVQHVCWYEAEAWCRWAGRRLPTETEWEVAATWDPAHRTKRRYPWGDDDPTPALANLGQWRLGPVAVDTHSAAGASPLGCRQLVGDVWEWTSTPFDGYPGFVAFPYREYSEVFHGTDYRVLRGGSWATHPVAVRGTFRNWDYPIRRQIFCGFRSARDA